jgi:hypothetical protein
LITVNVRCAPKATADAYRSDLWRRAITRLLHNQTSALKVSLAFLPGFPRITLGSPECDPRAGEPRTIVRDPAS